MSDQLQLVQPPLKLTDRQTFALAAITAAGYEGLGTDELGAIVHSFALKHGAADRCQWCAAAGMEVGKALRTKRLVQQRRRRLPDDQPVVVWTVAGKMPPRRPAPGVTYNEFPAGY